MLTNTAENTFPCAFGKYELLNRIGSGGMAEIFRARLGGIGGFERILVIKRLLPHLQEQPDMVQMFVHEAKLAAEVQHRNITQVYELGRLENGEYYIAMEHVPGVDLRQILQAASTTTHRLAPWFAVHVACEVLGGLVFAHGLTDEHGRLRNIVHRDVTPANIFVSQMGDVKLGDFGVAKDEARQELTRTGQMKGKVPYMAPEQLYGRPVDQRTDIFALGVVLWECLTQRRLFGGRAEIEAMSMICDAERKPPSYFAGDVPAEIDAIVLRALEPDPERRFATSAEMLDLLSATLTKMNPRAHYSGVRQIVEAVLAKRAACPTRLPVPTPPPLRIATPPKPAPTTEEVDRAVMEAVLDAALVKDTPRLSVVPHSGLIGGLQHDRLANRVSDLARGIWKDHLRIDGDYAGAFPLYVRAHEGTVVGPLSAREAQDVLRHEARAGFIEKVAISADQRTFMSAGEYALLTGQEMLLDACAHSEKEHSRSLISGSFERTSVTALFGRLAKEKISGTLTIANPAFGQFARREIELVEGRPTFVYANSEDLQLPVLLVQKNIILSEQTEELLHAVVGEHEPIEEVVLRHTGQDASLYHPVFMKERLLDLFRWTVGRYWVEQNAKPRRLKPFAPSLLALLPELVLRTKSVEELRVHLRPFVEKKLERSERFQRAVADMRLSEVQAQALVPFGGRTLAATLRASRDERLVLIWAYILLESDLLLIGD